MAGAPFPALTRARTHAHARSLQIRTKKKEKWNLLANVYPLTGGEQAEQGGAQMGGQAAACW